MVRIVCAVIALQSFPTVGPGDLPPPARVEREAWAMGTRLRIVAEGPGSVQARGATERVLREVERLEGLLSTWDSTTPLSRLNRAPVGERVPVPGELYALLDEVFAWSRETGGAFEPALGPLVDAWDLRGGGRIPDAASLERARGAAGPRAFTLGPSSSAATRRHPAAWIDAGGFGKGAALRAAARAASEREAPLRLLVDLGGQIWAGAPVDRPWRVPVAHPVHRDRAAAGLVLHGVSAATSGTSERWAEVDGSRLGHLLDPRSGRPAPAWGSVTVVHPDPLVADVLSTALYVMGPAGGMRWLDAHPGIAALFLEVRDGRLIPAWTGAMEPWLEAPPGRPAGAGAPSSSSLNR